MGSRTILVCDWCAGEAPAASDGGSIKGWGEVDDGAEFICPDCRAARTAAIEQARTSRRTGFRVFEGANMDEVIAFEIAGGHTLLIHAGTPHEFVHREMFANGMSVGHLTETQIERYGAALRSASERVLIAEADRVARAGGLP